MIRFTISRPLPAVALLFLLAATASAQRENNVWYFGAHAGLDFNGSGVRTITDGMMNVTEGSATICDRRTGRILFYTDGIQVWNRNYQEMLDAFKLKGGESSTQAALIVPSPADSMIYFIFSSGDEATPSTRAELGAGVVYAIVDMRLNGGLGGVTKENIPLVTPTCEKLLGVRHCNGTDYWVLTHGIGDDRFYAYLVDGGGVAGRSPVVSRAGAVVSSPRGYLVGSPDGEKLAMVVENPGTAELFDFDPCTGKVSNGIMIMPRDAFYGVCFSPDNTKLYIPKRMPATEIMQFDLSDGNRGTAIGNFSRQLYALQLGPDGRIYGTRTRETWLAAIMNPNAAGKACGYIDSAIWLGGRISYTGLPNEILGRVPMLHATPAPYDTVICVGSCARFSDASPGAPTRRDWFFPGGTPSGYGGSGEVEVCYDTPGRYDVVLQVENRDEVDSVIRHIDIDMPGPPRSVTIGRLEGAPGDTVTLELRTSGVGTSSGGYRPFLARLRFNRSLLYPLLPDADVADSGGDGILTLRGGADPGSGILASVRFLVTLADTDRCDITFDTLAWTGGCIDELRGFGGEFILTGLCRDGGERLVRSGEPASMKVAQWEDGALVVDYHLDERGPMTIYLVDMAGELAATIVDEPRDAGTYSTTIRRIGVPNGRYLCIMRTPSRTLSVPVVIGR